jgi:hypothetical protein
MRMFSSFLKGLTRMPEGVLVVDVKISGFEKTNNERLKVVLVENVTWRPEASFLLFRQI